MAYDPPINRLHQCLCYGADDERQRRRWYLCWQCDYTAAILQRHIHQGCRLRQQSPPGNQRHQRGQSSDRELLVQQYWRNSPQAGIDFEPNNENERLTRCILRNCRFENNKGRGITTYTGNLTSRSVNIDILFENCYVTSDKSYGVGVSGINQDGPGGLIEFRNCTIENVALTGLLVSSKAALRARVRFVGCTWRNVAFNIVTSPLIISGSGVGG